VLLSTAEDLASFVEELRRETDRGLALVATALIDERLLETLRAFFCKTHLAAKLLDEQSSPLGTFSSRTDMCFSLGLIDDFEHKEIGLLRKVRNEFAHAKHGLNFKSPEVQGFCSSLQSPLPEGADYHLTDPRFRFTNSTVCLVLRLYHRPDWVALERRQPKVWVPEDITRWRSVEDELPPEGVPVLVMAKAQK
jgi:DNA-binding MltR family transcriptional regulator